MDELPLIKFKGFTFQPRVKFVQSDESSNWYRFTIRVWEGERNCVIKGGSLYDDHDKAVKAAIAFGKGVIYDHVKKSENSLLYKLMYKIGYCPAPNYSQSE